MEYRVRQGGLMRCCLLSLDHRMQETITPPQEGETLACEYESDRGPKMVYRDGAWEWVGSASIRQVLLDLEQKKSIP